MIKILIVHCKPNPSGKDAVRSHPRPEQLLGEWVDLYNDGAAIRLSSLHLAHTQFSGNCRPAAQPTVYWNGSASDILESQKTVRIHTGKSRDASMMAPLDWRGADIRAYAESGGFVLNNDCGDVLSLWTKDSGGNWQKLDGTSYAPYPPEGAILVRQGNDLVAAGGLVNR